MDLDHCLVDPRSTSKGHRTIVVQFDWLFVHRRNNFVVAAVVAVAALVVVVVALVVIGHIDRICLVVPILLVVEIPTVPADHGSMPVYLLRVVVASHRLDHRPDQKVCNVDEL